MVWCVVLVAVVATTLGQTTTRLRVEYMDNPLGVDVPAPRFSWVNVHPRRGQTQTAYHLTVTCDGDAVWDSGKISSPTTSQIKYGGTALKSGAACEWTVQTWDAQGSALTPGKGSFTVGLLNPSDWAGAVWIGVADDSATLNQFRSEFDVPNTEVIARATASIASSGYYKMWVNGRRVGDHELGPFTTFEKRILYDTYDITTHFTGSSVSQAVAVTLGHGWGAQPSVKAWPRGFRCRIAIQYTSGKTLDVVSGTAWKAHNGPVVHDDIYDGETYDVRQETPGWTEPTYNDKSWSTAATVPIHPTHLTSHAVIPPIRIGQSYTPIDMWEPRPGVYVFDFGQNMAGFTTLTIPGGHTAQPGQEVVQRHAELLMGPHGDIQHHYSNTKEIATLILDGSGQSITYTPLFTYMGFRYVALSGFPGVPQVSTLTAHFVHTGFELTGDISFSDPLMDQVQHATRSAALSNHQNIPTDCPQRERRGWLGDAQLSAETNIHNFDMAASYTTFIQQIADAQDTAGDVQDCVPWYHHGGEPADPAWGSAFSFLTEWMVDYFVDSEVVKTHYLSLRKHLETLINHADPHHSGLLYFSRYGDWCPWNHGCKSPSSLVSSFMYILQVRQLAGMATTVGNTTDAAKYTKLAEDLASAFNKWFYNTTTHRYDDGEIISKQTALAMALELGVVPEKDAPLVLEQLLNDIAAAGGHLNTGIVGIKYLLPALTNGGRVDVALPIVQTREQPGYIYMVLQGATTLWESWSGTQYRAVSSRNHIMFGAQSAWYYQGLAGIQRGPKGFTDLTLKPAVAVEVRGNHADCGNLTSVSAATMTHLGEVQAAWHCTGGLCGTAQEKGTVKLQCTSGVMTGVDFASFGTPTGSCGSFHLSKCNSNNSRAVVERLCVGKAECTIPATNQEFHGDPCFGTSKRLYVQMSGCGSTVWKYNVGIPVGSHAAVHIPLLHRTDIQITENTTVVWSGGKYHPGVIGITGATATQDAIIIQAGSGTYQFGLSGTLAPVRCASAPAGEILHLRCPQGTIVEWIHSARLHHGVVDCESVYSPPTVPGVGSTLNVLERQCRGSNACSVPVEPIVFGVHGHPLEEWRGGQVHLLTQYGCGAV